jgi:hypothetical protein
MVVDTGLEGSGLALLRLYHGDHVVILRKTTECRILNSWLPDQDSNRLHFEYKSRALMLHRHVWVVA